jgi:hypothetical protein
MPTIELECDATKAEAKLRAFIEKVKAARKELDEAEQRRGWLYRLLRWIW